MAKFVEFRVQSSKRQNRDFFIYLDPRVIFSFGEIGESVFIEVVGGNCYRVLESLDAVKEKLCGCF